MTAEIEDDDAPAIDLPDMELAIIGACFLDPDAASLAFEKLRPAHFRDKHVGDIFHAMQKVTPEGASADYAVVRDELAAAGTLANGYIKTFVKAIQWPTAANVPLYVERILERDLRDEEAALRKRLEAAESAAGQDHFIAELGRIRERRRSARKGAKPAPEALDFFDTVEHPEPEAPEMFIDRMIVRDSLNIVFGPPSSGKSWLMMAACYDGVTTGGTLLGSDELRLHIPQDGREERCLWIYGNEDTEGRVRRRLKKLHKGGDPNYPLKKDGFLYQTPPAGMLLNTEAGWAWVVALIERYRPTLLVMDTVASLTASTLDVNKAEEVVPFMQKLLELRQTHHLTIFLGHHTNKPSKDADRGAVSKAASMLGSQAWLSMTEGCFMVDAKDGDTSDVKIRCIKPKDVENPIPVLRACLDRDSGRFRMLDEGEEAPQRDVVTKATGRKLKFTANLVLALQPRFPNGIGWNETMIRDALTIGHATWLEHRDPVASELLARGCCFLLGSLKWPAPPAAK